ncbi:MAG: FKBP-type peptidyl-prolyl cis-trans isomerase [Gemmatimonadaceae bacterium]
MKQGTMTAVAALLLSACASAPPRPRETIPTVSGETRTRNGIQYVDVIQGTGTPVANGKCVYTHYTGWLTDGTRIDTSRDAEPVAFIQGTGKVMRGWEIGFEGMRAGARRRLMIPYQLAYGAAGNPPLVPTHADMIFDVELVAVTDATNHQCRAWKDLSRSG